MKLGGFASVSCPRKRVAAAWRQSFRRNILTDATLKSEKREREKNAVSKLGMRKKNLGQLILFALVYEKTAPPCLLEFIF
jgi:hypothetical protein